MPKARQAEILLLELKLTAGGNVLTIWQDHEWRRVNRVIAAGADLELALGAVRHQLNRQAQEALNRVHHV